MKTKTVLSADSLNNNEVRNTDNEKLGKIENIMIDCSTGRVAYAVLSFGGFLGMGDKLFALPWSAMKLDTKEKAFVINVNKETLKEAEGFDKDNWPDFANQEFGTKLHKYYSAKPYWE